MSKHGKMNIARSVLALGVGILALVLLAPVAVNAQVTVKHVRVTVAGTGSTATYCDQNGTTGCDQNLWNLTASGITLAGGQTLVLTQTGTIPIGGGVFGGNFDTSDRVQPTAPTTLECGTVAPATLCTVTIELDTGSGLTPVFTSSSNPINNFNADLPNQTTHHEEQPWTNPVFSAANYTLRLGYADNVHGCTAPAAPGVTTCFPNPFNGTFGTTAATVFLGAGATFPTFPCPAGNCFDAGALLITGITTGPFVTVTQGGYGAPPHGHNPASILADNFGLIGPVNIGCAAHTLRFTTAAAIQNFLPQGGTPGTLSGPALVTNPTSSGAGVFAGQVLALQLNVALSGPVFAGGLGNLHIASGSLVGLTVSQVLDLANRALGVCLTAADIALLTSRGITTISGLNDVVDAINENFDGGNNGFLVP